MLVLSLVVMVFIVDSPYVWFFESEGLACEGEDSRAAAVAGTLMVVITATPPIRATRRVTSAAVVGIWSPFIANLSSSTNKAVQHVPTLRRPEARSLSRMNQ